MKSIKKIAKKPQKKVWFSEDRLAYISILFTLGMGALTAYALTRVEYLSQDTDFLVAIVIVDAVALVILGTLVGRQIWRVWSERRQRMAGHQLHLRMAVLFGGVTTFPAVIVTLFALFVVDYSLRGWFAEGCRGQIGCAAERRTRCERCEGCRPTRTSAPHRYPSPGPAAGSDKSSTSMCLRQREKTHRNAT